MRSLALKTACFLHAVAISCVTARTETVFQSLNCALTFPAAWRQFPVDGTNYYALVKSEDGAKSIILEVREVHDPRWIAVNDQFIQESRQAFLNSGAKLDSGKPILIEGFPSYEIAGRLQFQGQIVSTVAHIVIAGGKAYKINAMYLNGDALSDTELQTSLNSFHFLRVPPRVQSPNTPSVTPANFAELIGAVIVVVLLGTGSFLIIRAVRRVKQG